MDSLERRRWALRHRAGQALPFGGSPMGPCAGSCLAGCLEVPAWPGCLLSCLPASCAWPGACWSSTGHGTALPTAGLAAEASGTLLSQNNCELKWKDAGALGSIHIFRKRIRNSCFFSRFLKSRKTRCFHFFLIFHQGQKSLAENLRPEPKENMSQEAA